MKSRTDFVTNSSSSSFVIGKSNDSSATVNTAYSIIRDIYMDYMDKEKQLRNYVISQSKLGIIYDIKSHSYHFKEQNKEKRRQIQKEIKRNFGISLYDNFNYNMDWIIYKQYKDYETYWLTKLASAEASPYIHAPFTIADLRDAGDVLWLHCSYPGNLLKEPHDLSGRSELFEWYMDYDEFEDEAKDSPLRLPEDKNPKKNVCHLLGAVCIYSECGYIPQYVVSRLYDISEYACNHMG